MKKRFLFIAALSLGVLTSMAQETYQDTKFINGDLNGTARYVGMGGAMEALGADLSTISSNPAGLGLFRHDQISMSGGMVSQTGAKKHFSYDNTDVDIKGKTTNFSFDQIGLVWTNRFDRRTWLNVGFNYRKSRNFDQILNAVGDLHGYSQNRQSAQKFPYALELKEKGGENIADKIWTAPDEANKEAMGLSDDGTQMDFLNGESYLFGQYQKGYIGEYDINSSINLNDQFYIGATIGIYDVNYRTNSYYTENLELNTAAEQWEAVKIDGMGYDLKLGAIIRPFRWSPFRIGLYVHTPIMYDLASHSSHDLSLTRKDADSFDKSNYADYEFRVNTPWKFGLSLGHTAGNYLALGATYEYTNYSKFDNRIKSADYYYDYFGGYYENSNSDDNMNDHTEVTLKGVNTFKLGAEYKPSSLLALRLGYNYLSPLFQSNGFRDNSIVSPGSAYATSTDYANWKATNRFTAGVGLNFGRFGADITYQLNAVSGDFYPFGNRFLDNYTGKRNTPNPTNVKFTRHQLLLTFSYDL